jgi:hypothetical protein
MKWLGWFLVGFCLVLVFQGLYVARYRGDWTVLVRVGAIKPHRGLIEDELGPVKCVDPLGHDGQVNYLIARDPFDRHATSTVLSASDDPPYRFRRILYPLLAGGFGFLDPYATVCGLVFWTAVGGGLLAASCAFLCSEWQLPGIVILFTLFNPGIYLSAQVLTNDILAMGLGLAGVALWCRRRDYLAAAILAAAVLVRETSILFSIALALTELDRRGIRRAAILLLVSGLPCLLWSLWVRVTIPGGDGLHNLSLPLVGYLSSIPLWIDPARVTFGILTTVFLAASAIIAWKTNTHLLRVSCLAWIGLASILSADVWEHPGNALRAICPLWVFAAMAYGTCKQSNSRQAAEIPDGQTTPRGQDSGTSATARHQPALAPVILTGRHDT